MKDGSQTRKGADMQSVDFLKPKCKLKVGCWNVRTLYQAGKLAQLLREMENYNIDLLGVSEARWTGAGKRKLISGHTVLFSGRPDNQHRGGVAIIINKKHEKSLLEWKPVSDRLIMARFNSKYVKMTLLTCYAPTEDADEEEKDVFYDQQQSAIDDTSSHDVLLVTGDLNARTGSVNTDRERVLGKEGFGMINNNGERLLEICQENNLFIGGSLFQHKDIHKIT